MNPMLSIILCTRNRGDFLLQALRYFEEISSNVSWELVVVDNGSTDRTSLILGELIANASINVRVISEQKPGLSRARNAGWRNAFGDIIVFTDDDCYPQPDFIDEIWNNFMETDIGYLGGRILLYDPDDYPITIQTRDDRVNIAPRTFIEAGMIHGANMAARRDVLEELDGFDELLGAGTPFPSEDVDFISRASSSGFWGAYDPRPTVFHHHRRRKIKQVNLLKKSYDIGRGAYYMKCILDKKRRRDAAKNWYWSFRNSLRYLLHFPRRALNSIYELQGAFMYLIYRLIDKIHA